MKVELATNLKCGSCLAKLGPHLDSSQWVTSWQVDLNSPHKILTCELDDTYVVDDLVAKVKEAGFEATALTGTSPADGDSGPGNADSPQLHAIASGASGAGKSGFRWATYRPLLLVVAYIIGLTAFAEWLLGTFEMNRAMSHFMGFFFLGFAFFKLLNIQGFADSFSTYDIVAARSRSYALLYPWLEVSLGLLYLARVLPLVANTITVTLMAVGLVGVVAAVRRKQAIQCACLGIVFNLPMSSVTIVENSIMLLMAIAGIADVLLSSGGA